MKEYINFWVAKNMTDIALSVIVCIVAGAIYVAPVVVSHIISKAQELATKLKGGAK